MTEEEAEQERARDPSAGFYQFKVEDHFGTVIDASKFGNVARFINHRWGALIPSTAPLFATGGALVGT